MATKRATPSAGLPAPANGLPAPSAGVTSPVVFEPEALEQRRFERDRGQAVAVLVALAIPFAAFGINDALLAGGNRLQLAIAWTLRAVAVAALALTGLRLRRAPNRASLERSLHVALMVGIVLAVGTHFGRPRESLLTTRFELLCVIGFYVALPLRTRLQMVPALTLSAVSLSLVFFWHTGVTDPDLVSLTVCFVLANVLGILIARWRHSAEAEEEAAWRAVTFAHASLQRTVRELRAVRSVVPICPSCRKVRCARDGCQHLEAFVADCGDVEFSRVLCPACLQKEFGATLSGTSF